MIPTETQKLLFPPLRRLVKHYVTLPLFTTCSVAIISRGFIYTVTYRNNIKFGFSEFFHDSYVFDLASLTKPLVTALSVLCLIEDGLLDIDDSISLFYPSVPERFKSVKIFQLLNHTSGLPAHRDYWRDVQHLPYSERYNAVVTRILRENLVIEAKTTHVYSDLGFILLGDIIKRITGLNLNDYWYSKISRPFHLDTLLFYPGGIYPGVFIPTGFCPWSGIKLRGIVHDDNCRALGGICGHAGLFGSAYGVARLGKIILDSYLSNSNKEMCLGKKLREYLNYGDGPHFFGFDSPSEIQSSCGNHFSGSSRGHLGFTGTSFWLDFEKYRGVVVLTDAVACGEQRNILRDFRAAAHDLLLEQYLQAPNR